MPILMRSISKLRASPGTSRKNRMLNRPGALEYITSEITHVAESAHWMMNSFRICSSFRRTIMNSSGKMAQVSC